MHQNQGKQHKSSRTSTHHHRCFYDFSLRQQKSYIDASSVDALQQLSRKLHKKHATLIICKANSQALSILKRSGFIDGFGQAYCWPDIESAYNEAQSLLTI